MGFLRFLIGLAGVPIAIGGKALSLTVVILAAIVIYGARFARRDGKLGDVVVTAIVLVTAYTAVLAVFLSLSVWLDSSTYYNAEAHFRGTLGGHIVAHLQAIPFAVLIATVIGTLAFTVTRVLGRLTGKAGETRS